MEREVTIKNTTCRRPDDNKGHSRLNMTVRCTLGVLAAAALFLSCLPQPVPSRPRRDGLSEVRVYLQPVPPEARRITWTFDELSAVRNDGIRTPLGLRADRFTGSDLENRQTFLGSGFLPPGSYSGLSLTFREAALKGEDGDAALFMPENPLVVESPFVLAASEVLTLFLDLSPSGLVDDRFAFTPDFSLSLPDQDLPSLIGYLTIPESDRITVFNRKSLRVTGAISTGRDPGAMVVDEARGRAYVAVKGENAVEVVDVFRGDIRERVALRSGDMPVDLDLSEDGLTLITANYGTGTVTVIDPVQAVETGRIDVGRGPTSVTINRAGTRAYVTCSLSGTLSVVDLLTGMQSASIALEETTPLSAAFDAYEERLFVVGPDSPNLTVVDTASLEVTDRVYVGMGSESVIVDEMSGLAYVGRKTVSEIAVIDPAVHLPVDSIGLNGAPGSMTLDTQEKALFVVLPDERVLQKIDLVSRRIMAVMELDGTPREVAVVE